MTDKPDWRPSANIANNKMKNEVLHQIRQYFEFHNVLEVDTPILGRSTITDVHLDAMSTVHTNPLSTQKTQMYLQTSPEYFMKRLLCSGYPSIFQIAKCFRDDEVGTHHNPEFTMLEWYRLDFAMEELIHDVESILRLTLGVDGIEALSYQEAFSKYLSIDVFGVSLLELMEFCEQQGFEHYVNSVKQIGDDDSRKDMLLQLLFSERIEAKIGNILPTVITHFPASQASLAKLNMADSRVAQRFEVYYRGMELANGFEELGCERDLRTRFERDNIQRSCLGKATRDLDEKFLQAHSYGLPACSGVALGIDRLLMIKSGASDIGEVQTFSYERV
ncbi:elongation factor P--(R)-beta-lysine ligase [Glaciecola sp. MH2013]|nr:elongation factor P--(R)-beta-lysine ligase [Glaciecola sp. MH2013]